MPDFVHLHNHTHYSLLDGACTVDGLVEAAAENKMGSVALTDHGVLFGLMEFYRKAKSAGVKPILGCELYVARNSRFDRAIETSSVGRKLKNYSHLIVLAKDATGYKNLIKLSSLGHTEGFYYKPRVDMDALRSHHEGLVALSACAGGVVASPLINDGYDAALGVAREFKDIFGDDFYLELQNHHIERENLVLEGLPRIAHDLGVKLICTNDCHYVKRDQAIAHNVLLNIKEATQGSTIDVRNLRYQTDEVYFRTASEMHKLFKAFPTAIDATFEVAEKCNVEFGNERHMPNFPVPPQLGGISLDEYLTRLTMEGMEKRYPAMTKDVLDRAEFELGVIKKTGYAGYFLIVQDFISAARKRGISVGPGRGSAAGSLVAYSLGITNVDPLRYNLLFERFLNPERVSMPDIDIDFEDDRRGEVIQYVKEKYGEDSVTQIITFGTLSARAVLKDVGRVLGIPISTIESITKNIPVVLGKVTPLKEALDLQELRWVKESQDPKIKELIEYSLVLEGFSRNVSTHAAGIVIAPGPVDEYVPLYKTPTTDVMTQYNMKDVEEAGLLKMDFLGLRTLTIIANTLKNIQARSGVTIDIDAIPLDDEKTYSLFGNGLTVGVFQFESSGMQEYLRKLKPASIEDLTAMNALYRPGPMQHIDEFIDCKQGKRAIEYLHPLLEPILKETYGVIVVQEQVMRVARDLAGFSLAKADEMRRAMGKKDAKKMAGMRTNFINGCAVNGIPADIAQKIFEKLEKFASYGFNKSHSLAYSYVAYQTAYLKAHYPAEFFAADLSAEMGDQKRVVQLIEECKKIGVKVLPPDVNESGVNFSPVDGGIRFGLAAIKNVGESALQSIIASRDAHGKFKSIFEFGKYVDTRIVNRKTLESLIQAGAFDSISRDRAKLFATVDNVLQYAVNSQSARLAGQEGLFDSSTHVANIQEPSLVEAALWSEQQTLGYEKQALGFYVSGHPLKKFEEEANAFATLHFGDDVATVKHGSPARVCGIITGIRTRHDKRERQIAFVEVEDFTGKGECIFWAEAYKANEKHIQPDGIVMIIGKADTNGEAVKIVADEVIPLSATRQRFARGIMLVLHENDFTEQKLQSLKSILEKNKGNCACFLSVTQNNNQSVRRFVTKKFTVAPSPEALKALRNELGETNVRLIAG